MLIGISESTRKEKYIMLVLMPASSHFHCKIRIVDVALVPALMKLLIERWQINFVSKAQRQRYKLGKCYVGGGSLQVCIRDDIRRER